MKKKAWKSIAAAVLIVAVIVITVLFRLSRQLETGLLILGAFAGLIPLSIDILQAAKSGKIHPAIPVLITILVLLYVGDAMIADIFTLLIVAGSLFKDYILWRVEQSVREISSSLPDVAYLKTDRLKEIHISEIKNGDFLVVKAGNRVPVDGILKEDEATLDESVITGESRLVIKSRDSHLIAGSINQGSAFEMQALATSENSTLAQIHKLVDEAQQHDTRLGRFTDKFVIINGAIALLGAILIYAATKDLMRALAFWVALVPVVFAIIVPVATTIGISLLARRGIMVKTGEALENITNINSIVFDKTGTLTSGSPQISKTIVWDNQFNEQSLLQLAAGIEKYSEHPLSKAFIRQADSLHLPIPEAADIKTVKGKGITGTCKGKNLLIGSFRMIKDAGLVIPPVSEIMIRDEEESGTTPILIAADGRPEGVFFLSDQLRKNIKDTVTTLKEMGIKLTMITGDNHVLAEKVATELGLTRFYAETLPQDKIRYIRTFKKAGERVMMIGDGINDAPAISESDVGVAMGLKGIDITLNSAKVVLVNDRIDLLPHMIILCRRVLNIIRLDLYLATGIHLLAAILSVFGVVTVLGSAAIHQISSVAVLLNTLRLYSLRK